MAYIVADRVKETTTVTGTGPATLAGASSGYRSFASQLSIGDTCAYVIVNSNASEWETGIGTYSAVNTLTRTTIHASTNANAAVVFTAGVKDVFMGPTADSLVDYNPVTGAISNATWNGSTISTSKGGTGLTTLGTANQALAVNSAGTALEYHTVVGSVASADGSVIVSQTGQAVDLSVAVAAATTNVIVQVRNNTGAILTKGTVVYINSAVGQIPTVAKALATSDATSAQTLGMLSADLGINAVGPVTIIGLIDDVNTGAYQDGDQLYLSSATAGQFTATKPYAPAHLVYVGVVEYAHAVHGKIFVKVQNGYELDELHDVAAQSPSNGQTIVYNSTSQLWEKNTVSLTAGVNGTLPVANGGTGVTTSTGTGSVVLSNTPTLVTPQTNAINAVPVVSGTGNSLTLTAGSGVGTGAGGNVVIVPGTQATSGGNGRVRISSDAAGTNYVAIDPNATQQVNFYCNTVLAFTVSSYPTNRGYIGASSTGGFAWADNATGDFSNHLDLALSRDAAGILAQRNGTNAQTFRIYNTYTDASNYERLGITWASNICTIGLAQAGTGSVRSLVIAGANATSGAGGNVTITAGNGSGVGAGGNIILQPGAQGTSGGDGVVHIKSINGTKTSKIYTSSGGNGTLNFLSDIGSTPVQIDTNAGTWNVTRSGQLTVGGNGELLLSGGTSRSCSITGLSGGAGCGWDANNGNPWAFIVKVNAGKNFAYYASVVNVTGTYKDIWEGKLLSLQNNSVEKFNVYNDGSASVSGSFNFPSSTTAFSANTNDLVLTASAFQRINCTSAASLTGIAPPSGGTHVDGRMVRVYNVGTANLTLSHNSASSTAANRMFSSTGADIILAPNDYAELIYDATSNGSGAAGWRVS